jgi:hypothetical protein
MFKYLVSMCFRISYLSKLVMCKNIFVVAAAAAKNNNDDDDDDDGYDNYENDDDSNNNNNNNNNNSNLITARNTFIFQNFHMFYGVRTVFYLMCTWVCTRTQKGRSMKLTTYLHPLLTLRISGSIHLLIIHVFRLRKGGTLLFYAIVRVTSNRNFYMAHQLQR